MESFEFVKMSKIIYRSTNYKTKEKYATMT